MRSAMFMLHFSICAVVLHANSMDPEDLRRKITFCKYIYMYYYVMKLHWNNEQQEA